MFGWAATWLEYYEWQKADGHGDRMWLTKWGVRRMGMLLGIISRQRHRTDSCASAKDAVAAMIKRLAHRNANVQLYTLEVS